MNAAVEVDLRYASLSTAAASATKVNTLTHCFYRYPARFGEGFVREAIQNFSRPGDVVLDPFCGGGTTLVEALASGRVAHGSDLSELAVFVASAKTTLLSVDQLDRIGEWANVATWYVRELLLWHSDVSDPRLAGLPPLLARVVCSLQDKLRQLPVGASRRFGTCLLLKTAQWAFDGKEHLPTPTQFVARFREAYQEMRHGMLELAAELRGIGISKRDFSALRVLRVCSAERLSRTSFGPSSRAASLVVTSPPYLGVHVLYNRWQIQGRRELHVPFFISGCRDIGVPSKYTIVTRRPRDTQDYYDAISRSFGAVNHLLADGAFVVQLVSFADANGCLSPYLTAMQAAGLEMCESYLRASDGLTWRAVPGRRWYARVRAVSDSSAAQEVLLIHRKGRRR